MDNYDFNDDFNDIYDEWIDTINDQPLTTSRLNDYSDVININQQIVNRIYNIRRYLEMNDDNRYNRNSNRNSNVRDNSNRNSDSNSNVRDNIQSLQSDIYRHLYNNINLQRDIFSSNLMTNIFGVLLEGIDFTTDVEFEDVKVTLTKQDFDKLFKQKIDDNSEYLTKECNICMDEYKINDDIVKLGCNHVFHSDCIRNWLCNERVTCPVCRKDTREDLNKISQ